MRQDFLSKEYPLSDQLCDFMDNNRIFFESLKLSNKDKFRLIPVIGITHLPKENPLSKDEVIGLFYLDKTNFINNRIPFFKQDFIVNLQSVHNEFISFSVDYDKGSYIRPLCEFFDRYGQDGKFYHRGGHKTWEHHYDSIEDLPDYPGLKEAAEKILNEYTMNR